MCTETVRGAPEILVCLFVVVRIRTTIPRQARWVKNVSRDRADHNQMSFIISLRSSVVRLSSMARFMVFLISVASSAMSLKSFLAVEVLVGQVVAWDVEAENKASHATTRPTITPLQGRSLRT